MLKSSADWLLESQYTGIAVMNPGGWDRANFAASWAEKITEEEFEKRLGASTCMWTGKLTDKAPACL